MWPGGRLSEQHGWSQQVDSAAIKPMEGVISRATGVAFCRGQVKREVVKPLRSCITSHAQTRFGNGSARPAQVLNHACLGHEGSTDWKVEYR